MAALIEFTNPMARKAYWTGIDGIAIVSDWRRRGVPITEVASRIGVTFPTLKKWRQQSKALDIALNVTDELVDGQVEGALLKRALGYTADEETWELVDGVMTRTKVVKKHVPPDSKACMFWLANRRHVAWRSTQPPLPHGESDVIDVKDVLVKIEEVAGGDEGDQAHA